MAETTAVNHPIGFVAIHAIIDFVATLIDRPKPLNAVPSPNAEAVAPVWEAVRAFVVITSCISASVNPLAVSMAFICSAFNDDCAIAALIASVEYPFNATAKAFALTALSIYVFPICAVEVKTSFIVFVMTRLSPRVFNCIQNCNMV